MKANYQTKQATSTEASLGTLYDINKQLMAQMEGLTSDAILDKINELREWIMGYFAQKYLMLLCHERRDYTLFNLNRTDAKRSAFLETMHHVATDIVECLTNRGEVQSMTLQEDGAWELWIKIEDECFAYYLFPYGQAVLEY